jgi:hypothetical protein
MYLKANLSPFIKCYKKRNLLAGATLGVQTKIQTEIVKLILDYKYVEVRRENKPLNEHLIMS